MPEELSVTAGEVCSCWIPIIWARSPQEEIMPEELPDNYMIREPEILSATKKTAQTKMWQT